MTNDNRLTIKRLLHDLEQVENHLVDLARAVPVGETRRIHHARLEALAAEEELARALEEDPDD